MNFILIPFLLATDLVSNDDAWNNGPEYSFSVSVSTISNVREGKSESKGESHLLRITLLTTLKCRPREPDYLNCHFEDTKIGRLSPKRFDFEETLAAGNSSYRPYGFSETNFEIKFDRNGIDGYIFEKDEKLMGQFLVDMFRMIANQLSIGTSLEGKAENFREKENFTMGECPAEYRIVRSKIYDHCRRKKLNLVALIDSQLNNEEVIRIERQRVLDECLPRDLSYFGRRYSSYGVVLGDHTDKLVSSTSTLTISRNCFTSETLNIVDIYDSNKKKVGSAVDRLRVFLDSIDPAQGSLKSLSNPTSVDVVVRHPSNYDIK